jgi:hypothetical protein
MGRIDILLPPSLQLWLRLPKESVGDLVIRTYATEPAMTRLTLYRQLVDDATRPLQDFVTAPGDPVQKAPCEEARDLFVWFEDTSERQRDGQRGIAGLPESLLPISFGMKVIERRYAPGHPHLLTALRIRCRDRAAERIAAIYTAALAVGTVAWIGTGSQYEIAWNALYAMEPDEQDGTGA